MRLRARCVSLLAIGCTLGFSATVRAQDTTVVPGVRLGLNYEAGTKPGVIVLPGAGSIRRRFAACDRPA